MISLGGAPRAMLEMRTSECLTSPPVGDPHSSPARAGVGEMPWWQDISARCNRPHGQDPRALDSKVGFYPDHIAKELVIGPKEPTSWHPGLQPPSCCFIVPRAPMFACASLPIGARLFRTSACSVRLIPFGRLAPFRYRRRSSGSFL